MATGRGAFLALGVVLAALCEPAATRTPSAGQTEDLFTPLTLSSAGQETANFGAQGHPGTTKLDDVTEAKQTLKHEGHTKQEHNKVVSIPFEDRHHVPQDSRQMDDLAGHTKGAFSYEPNEDPHVGIPTEEQAPDAIDRPGMPDLDLLNKSPSQKEKRVSIQTRDTQFPRFSGGKRYTGSLNRHSPKSADYQKQGHYFDLIGGHLLKRSDPHTHKRMIDMIAGNLLKKSYPEADKRMIDMIAGNLLKKSYPETDKRMIDMTAGILPKKSYPQTDRHNFDWIAGHLLKKSYPQPEKRNIDLIAGNLLKKSHPRIHKRVLDSLADSLLKKSFPEEDKRDVDLIARNPLKKFHPERYRSFTDTIAGNLIKKFDPQEGQQLTDSVVGDRLWKPHSQNDKRFIDTIANDLLKKSHSLKDKRFLDPIADNLLKRAYPLKDKRFIDPIADNLLKRSNPLKDKRFIDLIANHLLKKSSPLKEQRPIDSIAGHLIKKSRPARNGGIQDNSGPLSVPAQFMKTPDSDEDPQFIDTKVSGQLKGNQFVHEKMSEDLTSNHVSSGQGEIHSGQPSDPVVEDLPARPDGVAGEVVDMDNDRDRDTSRHVDSSTIPAQLKEDIDDTDRQWPDKRYVNDLLDRDTDSLHRGFLDTLAGGLLKRENQQGANGREKLQELKDKKETQRRLHSLRNAIVRDVNGVRSYVHVKRFLDWIAGHLLKKRGSHAVRDIAETQHYTFNSGSQHHNNGILKAIPDSSENFQTKTNAELEMEQPGMNQSSGQIVPEDLSRLLHTDSINTAGGNVLENRGSEDDKLDPSQENVHSGFSDAMNGWSKLHEEEKTARQRRAAPFSPTQGFLNEYGDSTTDSQTARDARFGLESRSHQVASAHDSSNRRLQKRFMPLPFLLTNLLLHTFPLPSVLKVSNQPGSDVSPEKHGYRNLELFTNDLPEGLSETRFRDSLSGGSLNSHRGKGPTGKQNTDLLSGDMFIPVDYVQPSETQFMGSSPGDVLKWYPGKGSPRKQDSGLSPDELPERVFCFSLKYNICFPSVQTTRPSRRRHTDDADAYDPLTRPTGTGFTGSDTSKLSKFPRSRKSETTVTPNMSELLTADAGYTSAGDKNPGEVHSTTRNAHIADHHGPLRKRFWMYKTLLHFLSGNPFKKQTPATFPRVTSHKRFIAPAVWQMLMEKNLYHYSRNFLDSIAGDLLK